MLTTTELERLISTGRIGAGQHVAGDDWLWSDLIPGARYILEDHDGYPIECPVCGQLDRWRAPAPDDDPPAGFRCVHPAEAGRDGGRRRVATVPFSRVGDALAWLSLVPIAARAAPRRARS